MGEGLRKFTCTGRCNRISCFSWDENFANHCVSLSDVYDPLGTFCPFSKDKGKVDRETSRLVKETIIAKKEREMINEERRSKLRRRLGNRG